VLDLHLTPKVPARPEAFGRTIEVDGVLILVEGTDLFSLSASNSESSQSEGVGRRETQQLVDTNNRLYIMHMKNKGYQCMASYACSPHVPVMLPSCPNYVRTMSKACLHFVTLY
jgi:hypothetical protein